MKIIESTDRDTGVLQWQLGEDPNFSGHWYTDNPSYSADGNQFTFMAGPDYFVECQAMICDIPSRTIQPACALRGVHGPVMSPVNPNDMYLMTDDGDNYVLHHVSLASGKTTEIARVPGVLAHYSLGAISPAGDKYSTGVTWHNKISCVIEIDLKTGAVEKIAEDPSIHNPHMNYSPDGRWLSLQYNHSQEWLSYDKVRNITEPPGIKNRVRAWERRERKLYECPFAPGPMEDIQGHQAWAGFDGLLLATTISFIRNRWAGSIWGAHPGDAVARLISDAYDFRHPSATLDGKTIACDEWDNCDLYLIDTATGKHKFLCHTGSIDWDKLRGVPAYSLQQWHPHPTISPEGKTVLFNSNRTGTAHAFVAFCDSSTT